MDKMSLLSLFIISIPEAMIITALGFQLAGLTIRFPRLLAIATAQAGFSFIIRMCPVPFGLHTIIQIFMYIIIVRLITRLSLGRIVIAALLGLTIYVSIEAIISPTLINLTNYSLREIINNPSLRISFYLPEATANLAFIFLFRYYNFKLVNFSSSDERFVKKDSEEKILEKSYLKLYILILLPIQLLAVLNLIFFVSQTSAFPNKYLNLFIPLFSLIVGVLMILSMNSLQSISKLKEKEIEAKKARETVTQLDKIIHSIRKQRHDFNHHLQAIYGLLQANLPERAKDYVWKMFVDISKPAELIKTDNPWISAVLYAKAGQAEARGVDFIPK
ncbi:MAG: Spo0B domain-containing protein [Clostridiales bacterium]|nr:Spo0B domain-containing protein [Clostridiales bacterium]MCF8022468.1 Spo0B domain-containing protein [Clostridiales bacterium]